VGYKVRGREGYMYEREGKDSGRDGVREREEGVEIE
jgi:hypothetical protein